MKRIILVLSVAAVMAMLLVVMAAPAMAKGPINDCRGGSHPSGPEHVCVLSGPLRGNCPVPRISNTGSPVSENLPSRQPVNRGNLPSSYLPLFGLPLNPAIWHLSFCHA